MIKREDKAMDKYDSVFSHPQISYELPLSKVIQALKNNARITTALETVKSFLSNCTNADVQSPDQITLVINDGEDRNVKTLIDSVVKSFGKHDKEHFDGIYNQTIWTITPKQIDKAFQFMVLHEPYPPAIRPFISLRVDYYFKWIDPQSGNPLEHQEQKSHLAVLFQRNSQAMPEFLFPFAEKDGLVEYLNAIKLWLPFKKLDEKSFRLVRSNKQGTKNVISKL